MLYYIMLFYIMLYCILSYFVIFIIYSWVYLLNNDLFYSDIIAQKDKQLVLHLYTHALLVIIAQVEMPCLSHVIMIRIKMQLDKVLAYPALLATIVTHQKDLLYLQSPALEDHIVQMVKESNVLLVSNLFSLMDFLHFTSLIHTIPTATFS